MVRTKPNHSKRKKFMPVAGFLGQPDKVDLAGLN